MFLKKKKITLINLVGEHFQTLDYHNITRFSKTKGMFGRL